MAPLCGDVHPENFFLLNDFKNLCSREHLYIGSNFNQSPIRLIDLNIFLKLLLQVTFSNYTLHKKKFVYFSFQENVRCEIVSILKVPNKVFHSLYLKLERISNFVQQIQL